MIKHSYRYLLWGLALVIFGSPSLQAGPVVTSVSGELKSGTIIKIYGKRFGQKGRVKPLVWDDMESGKFNSKWADINDLKISQRESRHPESKYNGHLNFRVGHNDGRFKGPSEVHPRWFVQYWFKLGRNWKWGSTDYSGQNRFLSNVKIFRMWNPKNVDENFVVAFNGWLDKIQYVVEGVKDDQETKFLNGYKDEVRLGKWHQFQFEFADSSKPGARDGQFRMWFNSQKIIEATNLITRENNGPLKRPFIVGFSEVWGPSQGEGDKAPNDFFIDDVYMDYSFARVELGDRPFYNQCTKREIFIPSSWSSEIIEAKVNLGSFNPESPLFLFVIDKTGEASAKGYPLVNKPIPLKESAKEKRPEKRKLKKRFSKKLKPDKNILFLSKEDNIIFGSGAFEVQVFDQAGHLVNKIVKEKEEKLLWDGTNNEGRPVRADDYLCKIIGLRGNVVFHTIVVLK